MKLTVVCHFITAALPKNADLSLSREIFHRHKLGFELIENPSVQETLAEGDHYILTTSGMCDCGTILGSEFREPLPSAEEMEKYARATVDKLRKKGWSEAKIQRWLNEAELNKEKERRGKEAGHYYNVGQASGWLEFITDFLNSKAAPRLSLLLHYYSGPLSERILLHRKETISLPHLNAASLLSMEEDVIHEVSLT